MEKSLSATDAVRKFSELLNSIKYRGSRYTIVRSGKPVAVLCPVEGASQERTLGDLREIWKRLPRLGGEAERFENDLKRILAQQPAMPETGRWG